MTTTTIRIPAPAPYLNANDNLHWSKRAERVATWRAAAYNAAHRLPHPRWTQGDYPVTVDITLDVTDNRRRDPANYAPTAKAIIDGLSPQRSYTRKGRLVIVPGAGWWPDDDPTHVIANTPTLVRVAPRVGRYAIVTITTTTTERA